MELRKSDGYYSIVSFYPRDSKYSKAKGELIWEYSSQSVSSQATNELPKNDTTGVLSQMDQAKLATKSVTTVSQTSENANNFRFSVSGDGTDFNRVDRKWVVSAMGNDLTSTADTLLASNPSEAAKQGVAPKGLYTIGDVFDNVKPDGEKKS